MYQVKPIINKQEWENFLLASPQVSFLQSWNWGIFHEKLGHKIFRLGLFDQRRLCGLALLIKISARRATYLECPAGPVIPWKNQIAVNFIFKFIKNLAKSQGAVFVRIRPNIETQTLNYPLIKAPMHLHAETTWVLDLNLPPETLLANMRKTTRHEITKAVKLGVIIKTGTVKDIPLLFKLQLEVVKRQKFTPFSEEYLLKQWQAFNPDRQIKIYKAVYQGQLLAISFIIFYGAEAVYHYSGSRSDFRHIPASAALQWQAILAAKKLGFSRYNFWGIAPNNNPRHRFAGVTIFKKGFGGRAVNYFPAHDLIIRPGYWLDYLFESLRRRLRRL